MRSHRRHILLASIVLGALGICSCRDHRTAPPVAFVALDSVALGTHTVQFYVDHGDDSAVLGFSAPGPTGPRHFPLYGSTYRGLPAVTLEVYAPEPRDQMWVRSSWKGHEALAHYRVGSDRCMTGYGAIRAHHRPTPRSLGGGSGHIPPMDRARVTKIATIVYPAPRS